jgi:CubicO group peptidase (beta-lactamase class C family)
MTTTHELTVLFDQLERSHRLSGAVLVSRDGEVLFEKAYGFASRQLAVPNALDTKFHIASLTKMLVAMAALVLSEQGRISLQEKPATYLPELAALDKGITLHHLLSHTSGLQDIYDVSDLRFEMHRLKNEQGSLLSYLAKLPQLFRPGEGWSYSSTGNLLMGYVMERVVGAPFEELMKRYVLAPLAMTNTGMDVPRRINPGRAYGHAAENGQLFNADNDRLSLFEDAPGELYSTVRDLSRWCDSMFDCPLVPRRTLRLMFTPHGQVDASLHYGYGWFLAPRYRMHGGGTSGFLSRIKQYPEQKVSVVLLLNSDETNPGTILETMEPLFA